MRTYFDTSAFVKLFIDERGSNEVRAYWDESRYVISSSLMAVEATSVLSTARLMQKVSPAQLKHSIYEITELEAQIYSLEIDAQVIGLARSIALDDSLNAADAIHLASAITSNADVFVCADRRLCEVALAHGLSIFNPEAI